MPRLERGFYSYLWVGQLADAGARAIAAARSLGSSPWASTVRAWSVPLLRYGAEEAFAKPTDPKPELIRLVDGLADYFEASARTNLGTISPPMTESQQPSVVESVTGQHYGNLFREFTPESFAGEPLKLLSARLGRNDVALPDLSACSVLDAGCGGGRYSVAWHLLGAKHVLGVDLSEHGIEDANARVRGMKIDDRVRFQLADVVTLPLPDNSFDIVFSNGVLHHTRDWGTGITNLVRVLKPGGLGWLYLIENPGGYFWDINELCRDIMSTEDHERARVAVASLGIPANRVFYVLDHAMAPINVRLTPDEITDALAAAGAKSIRRLVRGADFDRVERIHQNDPFAREKFGVGENRFVFTK